MYINENDVIYSRFILTLIDWGRKALNNGAREPSRIKVASKMSACGYIVHGRKALNNQVFNIKLAPKMSE